MALENKGPGGVKNSYGVRTASTEALANSAIPKNTYNEYGAGVAVTAIEQAVQAVATRGEVNLIAVTASTADRVRLTGRSLHKTGRESLKSIGGSWTNWYLDTSRVEQSIANAVTVRAHIEIPDAPTPVVTLTFGGASSGSMASGVADFPSDLAPASAFGLTTIPANTSFYIVTEYTVTSTQTYPASVAPQEVGEACTYGNGSASQIGVAGTLTNQSGGAVTTALAMPSAVIGVPSAALPAVVLFGDSIVFGAKDGGGGGTSGGGGGVAGGGLYVRAAWNAGLPYIRQARTGTTAQQAIANYTKQAALWKYATHFVCNLGTNDLNTGRTAAQTLADLRVLWTAVKAAGVKRVEQALIMSRTTSTDTWATVANQTAISGFETGGTKKDALNTSIMGNVGANGLGGFIDVNPEWSDVVSQDKVRAPGYVDDGTHPLPAGAKACSPILETRMLTWRG